MTEEYYIRSPEAETARGPYDVEKLVTLAEAGQVAPETLYYDDDLEAWVALGANAALRDQVFPQRKSLKLRKREETESDSDEDDERPEVSVSEMLAAAEGTTEETRYVKERERWAHRTAALSVPALGILLLASAATFIYPSWKTIEGIFSGEADILTLLLQQPHLILGGFDLVAGVLMLLAATEIFPLIRFRAMLGGGYLTVLYLADFVHGDSTGIYLAAGSALFGAGIFTCTLTLNFRVMAASVAAAAAGIIAFAFFGNLLPIFFGD
ncbi:MAG: hypothetical protein JJU00_05525 [Opitutales bacterium]|nr:hypothetical protein [Opitutales bacterium]